MQPRMVWTSKSRQHSVLMEMPPSGIEASSSEIPRIRLGQDEELFLLFHLTLAMVHPRLAQYKTRCGGASAEFIVGRASNIITTLQPHPPSTEMPLGTISKGQPWIRRGSKDITSRALLLLAASHKVGGSLSEMCHARSTLGIQGWEQFHQEEESQVTVLVLQELLLLFRYLKDMATKSGWAINSLKDQPITACCFQRWRTSRMPRYLRLKAS